MFSFAGLLSRLLGPKALGTSKKHSHTNRVKQIVKKHPLHEVKGYWMDAWLKVAP